MTSSNQNEKKKKSHLSDIYGEIVFIIIPFIAFVLMSVSKGISDNKGLADLIKSLIGSTDWSLISAVIFGQSAYKISKVIPNCGSAIDGNKYTLYLSVRILYIFISLIFYSIIFFTGNIFFGMLQVFMFFFSLFTFMKDSLAAYVLIERNNTQ